MNRKVDHGPGRHLFNGVKNQGVIAVCWHFGIMFCLERPESVARLFDVVYFVLTL